MSTYYHYTDEDSAKKIKKSGHIRQSGDDGKDAAFGKGTYLTKLSPKTARKTLAYNNYDDSKSFHQSKIDDGKLDCYVKVKIPKDDPKIEKMDAGKRDVYKYDGNLNLKDNDHDVRRIVRKHKD